MMENKSPALAPTSEPGRGNNKRPHPTKPPQKWKRVLAAMAEGKSFNRFEAEHVLNDHCLHSTVSTIQAKGVQIERRRGAAALSKHLARPCAKCLRSRGACFAPTALRLGNATMALRWVPTQLSGALRQRSAIPGSSDEVVPGYQGIPTHVCRYWLAPENTDRAPHLLGLTKWRATD